MKKGILIGSVFVALLAVGAFVNHNRTKAEPLSKLAMENIDALSNDEETGGESGETCTRATITANCYQNGIWVAKRIIAVEEYTRTSIMIECRHDRVTECPFGSSEGV